MICYVLKYLCYFFFTYVYIDHADNVFGIVGVRKNVCKQDLNYNIMMKLVVGVEFERLKTIENIILL